MRAHGFHVLHYFNVTEFGKNMQDTAIPAARADHPALWKDPVAFLKLRLSDAYLKPPILTCYNAWVTDVGDPAYRQFMLDQAKRHIALLPDTGGICVDRNDWLHLDNPTGDDGVSWVDGNPARSLYRSWIAFMDELGPLMHSAGKVIFANTMTMRLELTRQLDGIYNEFGNNPGALNASALMGIRKPVLGWTTNEALLEPDPDSFFQRHLYLGVYSARCVNAVTPGLGVNLFEVPGGYAFAGHVRRQGRLGPGPPPQLPRPRPGEMRGPESGRRGFGARPGNLQGRSAGTSGPPEAGLCDGPADEFVVVRAR